MLKRKKDKQEKAILQSEREQKLDTAKAKEMVTIQQIRKGKVIATRHSDKITTAGLEEFAKLFGGTGTAFTYLALGTGTTPAAAGDTALEAELADTGLERIGVTPSYDGVTVTLEHTWTMTATGTVAVTEEGEFNAETEGVMVARQVFAALNASQNDEIKITHRNVFAEG